MFEKIEAIILKILSSSTAELLTNDCKLLPLSDFDYASHTIKLDRNNMMGIEYNWLFRIRIDGIRTTDKKSFKKMMDSLVNHAKDCGYNSLLFADHLDNDVLNMFLEYGFIEETGDRYNHYLTYEIN